MEQDQKKRPWRAFSSDFKAEAVRLSKSGDRSVGQVARDLGIVESNLRNWIRQADVDSGAEGSGSLTIDERNELTRLRRENKRLMMEREILKEATVLSSGQCNAYALNDHRRRYGTNDETFPRGKIGAMEPVASRPISE